MDGRRNHPWVLVTHWLSNWEDLWLYEKLEKGRLIALVRVGGGAGEEAGVGEGGKLPLCRETARLAQQVCRGRGVLGLLLH